MLLLRPCALLILRHLQVTAAATGTPLRSPNSTTRKPRGSNLSGGAAMGQRVGTGSPPGSESRSEPMHN
jgi:hypothetical protein